MAKKKRWSRRKSEVHFLFYVHTHTHTHTQKKKKIQKYHNLQNPLLTLTTLVDYSAVGILFNRLTNDFRVITVRKENGGRWFQFSLPPPPRTPPICVLYPDHAGDRRIIMWLKQYHFFQLFFYNKVFEILQMILLLILEIDYRIMVDFIIDF